MARKVKVHPANGAKHTFYVNRRQAEGMVLKGLAKWSSKWTVILIPNSHHQARGLRPSNQGGVYELAAIEKHRLFTQGGMTRNEHRPIKFQIARAARVGHQQ